MFPSTGVQQILQCLVFPNFSKLVRYTLFDLYPVEMVYLAAFICLPSGSYVGHKAFPGGRTSIYDDLK